MIYNHQDRTHTLPLMLFTSWSLSARNSSIRSNVRMLWLNNNLQERLPITIRGHIASSTEFIMKTYNQRNIKYVLIWIKCFLAFDRKENWLVTLTPCHQQLLPCEWFQTLLLIFHWVLADFSFHQSYTWTTIKPPSS